MTICDVIETAGGRACRAKCRLLLFFLCEGAAALLIGFAAFFLSFEPALVGRTPAAAFLKPGDARSGSLLLKTDDGYADASRLGIDVDLTVSGPTIRARVTQIFRNPTQGLGRGGLCLSAAGRRRGRHAEDGDRRSRRRRRHQGAAAGPHHLRAGEAERPEGRADRTGAAEHLHQLGRQYRPRRNRAGADRISGAGAAVRRRILAAGADGGRAALQSRSRRAERRLPADGGGWGQANPIPCRIATASRRRCSTRASNAPVNPTSITVRLQAGFPLGEVKSHHHAVKTESADDGRADHQARRRPGTGGPRFRADLEAGRREGAVSRTVPRTCRRRRLSARLCHAAVGRAGRAEAAAARSRSS